MAPDSAEENGLLWRDNKDGETKAALQNYITTRPSRDRSAPRTLNIAAVDLNTPRV
jgi:hypothetical protein